MSDLHTGNAGPPDPTFDILVDTVAMMDSFDTLPPAIRHRLANAVVDFDAGAALKMWQAGQPVALVIQKIDWAEQEILARRREGRS